MSKISDPNTVHHLDNIHIFSLNGASFRCNRYKCPRLTLR